MPAEPRTLLKYLPNARFFEKGLLRFSQPGALNDPYEARPAIAFNKYAPEDYAAARLRAEAEGMSDTSDDDLETFFMNPFPSRRYDEESAPGLWPYKEIRLRDEPFGTISEINGAIARKAIAVCRTYADQNFGILSLSSSNSEPLWAHYASNHAGLAIGFKFDHPYFRRAAVPMQYTQTPISVSSRLGKVRLGGYEWAAEDILNSRITAVPLELFLRKQPSWSYECEWRIVMPLSCALDASDFDAQNFPVALFQLPPDTIDFVLFGHRAGTAIIAAVRDAIARNKDWSHVVLRQRVDDVAGLTEKVIT